MKAVERLLAAARAEIGYLEKASNKNLDDKTANAGSGNWTKYARDLDKLGVYHAPKNGLAWCDMFVDWLFVTVFGLELGLAMTCQPKGAYGAGCTESRNYYKAKGRFFTSDPQPGDQIFFSSDGGKDCYHTGIVEKVEGGRVYTIEGNTGSAPGVIPNGGCVRDKSYTISYNQICGYGRPDWSLVETPAVDKPAATPQTPQKDTLEAARCFDASVAGTYSVTADGLNIRLGAGTDKKVLGVLTKGTKVQCYGYYNLVENTKWLCVVSGGITGYCSSNYLRR